MAQVDGVTEVVEELKEKIENLKNIGTSDDDKTSQKINDIRQKAIYVLSQASDKIIESVNNVSNVDEIEKAVGIVKVKSKELYENAMNRIKALTSVSETQTTIEAINNEIEEINNEIKEDTIVEETKIEPVVETKLVQEEIVIDDEIIYEAISVLRDWLKER